ncbi:MAG: efflux RND transporter periplasmic adaptor subunit [Ruminococcaceae bacterium]|nr:efflux RND transporter periplasmic adaptor subunit [Oscillospiraceae bacterium]
MKQKRVSGERTMRRLALLICAALIGTLMSGCYLLPEEEATLEAPKLTVKEVTYSTHEVALGDIERWEEGIGHFASTVNETLLFGKSGTLKKIHVRSGDEVTAGQLLAELDTNNIEDQIEYQEYVVEKAKLSYYAQAENGYGYSTQIAKLDYEYQQKQLEKLYAQAEDSAIYAPFDGVITYAAGLAAGDYIDAERGIVTIADPTQLIIVYKPTNVDDIYTGMTLDITMKNDESTYPGTVVQTPADVPADASDEAKTSIYIELDKTPEFADIGTKVDIRLLLDSKENVIVLPSKYISKVATRYYVRVLVDGLPEERDITLGINNGSHYEITGGLEVGEEIVA